MPYDRILDDIHDLAFGISPDISHVLLFTVAQVAALQQEHPGLDVVNWFNPPLKEQR